MISNALCKTRTQLGPSSSLDLGRIYVFFTLFGYWVQGGFPNGLGHNLLMQFFTLGSSKIEVLESYSSEPVIT